MKAAWQQSINENQGGKIKYGVSMKAINESGNKIMAANGMAANKYIENGGSISKK